MSALRTKSLALVSIPLALLGALGSIASIASGYGLKGAIGVILLASTVAFGCYLILKPMLAKNERGVTLLQAINSAGLVDIENRIDSHNPVAPSAFMASAKQEIAISGISLSLTFRLHLDLIQKMLRRGVKVRALLLHPDTATTIGSTDRRADIAGVINVINSSGLVLHPGFAVRFRKSIPPFTAIMVDGDIEPTGEHPNDKLGQIRIQPSTAHSPLQSGTALRFRRTIGSASSYDFFANDLRRQWQLDSISCPELLSE